MKSLLFVQIGDFRQAYEKFADGQPETYRDQKKSVDFVSSLAPQARVSTVAFCPNEYEMTEIVPNLWAQGLNRAKLKQEDVVRIFDTSQPTHVILRTPHRMFMAEARKRGIRILPAFADLFENKGIRQVLRNIRFAYDLRKNDFPCVSNHSLNASMSMVKVLRQPVEKVVPWDWSQVPLAGEAKRAVADPQNPTAFYAGMIQENKGVGDCLQAIKVLKARGVTLSMRFAGGGDTEPWINKAKALGIQDQVSFLGLVSNEQVRQEMHAHDFVIVPSHHSYPEGLPNTIYEGLASRSVLVMSDHPAFMGRLEVDQQCLMFPAQDAAALADVLQRAIDDTGLYHRISKASEAAHDQLYVGLPWASLVQHYIDDPQDATGWVARNSLKTYLS